MTNIDYEKYASIYRGDCAKIEYVNSAGELKSKSTKELNIAKMICEDWTTLIYGETNIVKVITKDEQGKLNEQEQQFQDYFDNFVRNRLHSFTEQVFAIGQGIAVPFVENGEVKVDFLVGDMFNVKEWSNGLAKVIEYKWKIRDQEIVTKITNTNDGAFIEHNGKLPEGVETSYELDYPIMYWKPNITNNKKLFTISEANDESGISVFGNCCDSIVNYGKLFTHLVSDISKSQKKIGVHKDFSNQVKISNGEKVRNVFNFDDDTFLLIDGEDFKGKLQMVEATPITNQIIDAMSKVLNDIGDSVGLKDYYETDTGVMKTATERITEKSETYARKQLHQMILKTNITMLVNNIMSLMDLDVEFKVEFNDSIITDDNKKREEDRLDVAQGLLPKYEYMVRWQGYDADTAKQIVMESEQASATSNLQTAPINL